MGIISFYIVFLLGAGLWGAGFLEDNNQTAFMAHMFSFGFSLLAAIGSVDVTHVSNGEVIQSSEPILGAVALGIMMLAGGCALYRASRTFANQRGLL